MDHVGYHRIVIEHGTLQQLFWGSIDALAVQQARLRAEQFFYIWVAVWTPATPLTNCRSEKYYSFNKCPHVIGL
jgi:hypothetical protein